MKLFAHVLLCGPLLALGSCNEAPTTSSGAGSAENASTSPDAATEFCRLTMQDEKLGECDRLRAQYAELDAGVDAFRPNAKMREYQKTTVSYAITRLPDEVQGGNGEMAAPVLGASPQVAPQEATIVPSKPIEGSSTPPAAIPSPEPSPTGPTQEEIDQAIDQAQHSVSTAIAPGEEGEAVQNRLIKMARKMHACLDAEDSFTIDGPACRTIDTFEHPVATWHWTITPTEPGNHTLVVQSSVELAAADGSVRLIPQKGQDATIDVEVTAYGRWKRFLDQAEAWIRSPLGVIAALTALVVAVGGLIGAIRKARRGEGSPPKPGGTG